MPQLINKTDWRTLIRRIKSGKFTPIISDRVCLPGTNSLLPAWAREIGYPYPLDNGLSIARLAQFKSALSRDDLAAKEDFLDFSKQHLLNAARRCAPDEQNAFLDTLEAELCDITFSEVAARLGYPQYENELDNPLRILAELPLSIYITTSYYDFIEASLKAAGKAPRTEICYWYEGLEEVPSLFREDPDFQPTPDMPLVYHLHGFDAYPASLVLTEDDYLDFLVRVSQDIDAIPRRVSQALTDSSLLLLGYRLDDWNFKVLFRGLITARRGSRRLLNLSIQVAAATEGERATNRRDVEEFLLKYFSKADFDVYWGEPHHFTQELWEQWER